ncbi:unnamed protein product [Hymenolepis diminuta]|uniref:Fucosyltransferase n=1 Tax=Hymenolepis diminuta TaxID=6216 RepID=A0A158QBM1_HYMDI|nr:unnamed protein product [Hymenolepis diminuta]
MQRVALTGIIFFSALSTLLYLLSVTYLTNFQSSETKIHPYQHIIDQIQWITEFADNKTEFKAENPPRIYYDRKFLYHLTQPEGCRYKCIFTDELQFLGRGDAAVFSDSYSPEQISKIKERGVIIVFESGESPVHMPILSQKQLRLVDIYGGRNKSFPEGGDLFEYVSRRNKFYLAFENSNCRNYITEKVTFNALQHDMIPIVLGAYKEDYEAVLPPHSYINVDDFKTIRELTDYIKYLDRNDTAYAKYFTWKEYGKIIDPIRMDCRLCGFMYHLRSGKIKISQPNPKDFVDPESLCFYRPLLPIE